LNTHRELFQSLKKVVDNGDIVETTEIDDHVAKLFLFDFEQCGIHLEEELRQKVVHLNECILHLGQRFMAGAVNPRSISKKILPENIRHMFSIDGDNILVSGLYADSPNALAREAAYRLYLYPDPHQEDLLSELLRARHDLATICGFKTYGHRALKASTMEHPDVVKEFLDILSEKIAPRAQKDFAIMQQMKLSDGGLNTSLQAWDSPYFTSRMKNKCLKISSQATEFMPYFSLGGCMEGFNGLMKSLFGIKLENVEMGPGESWSEDVYKLCVTDENDQLLGHIYCDFFERTGKPNQDCHFTIQGGKTLPNGEYQNPIVVVMLNFSLPRWNPTLLTPSMVDNLFHEMGHAMHSMLGRTEYQHVTGTRCSTDFAEVPSVLMEYFSSDPRVLKTFVSLFFHVLIYISDSFQFSLGKTLPNSGTNA
jgi:mitochondrial intermediate peptidase